jgi:hypothetical protein
VLSFEVGTHLLVEVMDDEGIEVVGGHLVVADDFGVTLNTTHKIKTVVPQVTEVVREQIRGAVEKLPKIMLRMMAAVEVEDVRGAFKLTQEDMIKVVCFAEERKYVEENTHKSLVRLATPVLTFYSRDVVRTAEVTEDYNVETAMGGLDDILAGITADTKEVLDESNGNETSEDKKLEP